MTTVLRGLVLTVTLAVFMHCAPQPSAFPPPNIVFLFSDDHSVPDLGVYGNPTLRTPHLDRLAAAGMRFTRAYVTSPQCSPSRASILTGLPPHTVGASRLHASLRPTTPTVVDALNAQGYHTGAYRKVHQEDVQKRFDFYGDESVTLDTKD